MNTSKGAKNYLTSVPSHCCPNLNKSRQRLTFGELFEGVEETKEFMEFKRRVGETLPFCKTASCAMLQICNILWWKPPEDHSIVRCEAEWRWSQCTAKIRAAVKCLADCRNLALPFGWMHLFFHPISHSFTCLFVLYSPAYSFFFFVLSFFSFFSFSFFYLLIGLIFCFSFSKKYMYMIIVYVVVYIPV